MALPPVPLFRHNLSTDHLQGDVLFDLDGVLVHGADKIKYRVRTRFVEEHGGDLSARDSSFEALRAVHPTDLAGMYGLRGVTPEKAVEFYREESAREIRNAVDLEVDPLATPLIAALQASALGVIIVTNNFRHVAEATVERASLHPDLLITSDEVEKPKPAADMLRLGIKMMAQKRGRPLEIEDAFGHTVMIGDGGVDQQAAKAANLPFVGLGIPGDWSASSLLGVWQLLLGPPPELAQEPIAWTVAVEKELGG